MVCPFAILFKIVFDDFSFSALQIKLHTSRMHIEVSGLSTDKGQANNCSKVESLFQPVCCAQCTEISAVAHLN